MKKLLITATLASFALTAQAENLYVQGDLGYSAVDAEIYNNNIVEDKVFTQRISIGYDFDSAIRIAADYTNFDKAKDSPSEIGISDSSVKIKSIGVSAIYDFHRFTDFVPYLGVRASHNRIKTNVAFLNGARAYRNAGRQGLGVLAGVQRNLNERVALNIGAEYNRFGNDYYNIGANVGLRYNF